MTTQNTYNKGYDGMFFRKGMPFNQGNIFSFNDEAFIDGCEKAIEKFRNNRVNEKGLELQQKFTYEKTTDNLLQKLEEL